MCECTFEYRVPFSMQRSKVWVFLGFLSRVKNRSQSCSDREIKKKKKCLYVLFILIGEKSAKIVPLLLYPRGTVESMQPGTM